MTNECTQCENEALMELAELEVEHDKIKKWLKLTENALDIKEELNKELRKENENLKYKLELYKRKDEEKCH